MAKKKPINPADAPPPGGGLRGPAGDGLPEFEKISRLRNEADQEAIRLEMEARRRLEKEAEEHAEALVPDDFLPAAKVLHLRELLAERARRRMEAMRLYEPLPEQARFHQSKTRVRVVRGSNRGGKTVPCAVEVARAVTAQDPYGKYPKRDGRCYCVGKNLDHVGQVMWRKLGRAGAIKMIRDLQTGCWRAYRPWDAADKAREDEAKPAPPLIPPRLVKAIAWENKAKVIPKTVTLTNGWEINFYSSEGKPPQGSDLDLVWFDEEIVDEDWYPEMRLRLLDRKGKFIWSATPQAGTEQLFMLHERAAEEDAKQEARRTVSEFVILLIDNPHIDGDEKKDLMTDVAMTDEEYRVRIEGEFLFTSFKVYPQFSMERHGVDWLDIPRDWCRYLVVDPGYQVCAALFAAVPPPSAGDHVYLYDELYIKDCTPQQLAEAVDHKVAGASFQAFLIDYHGSLRTEGGVGKSLLQQYTEAFAARNIKSAATGSGFILSSDDVKGGIMAVQIWLRDRPEKGPKLRVLRGVLKNFEREIKYYHYRRESGGLVSDKPMQRNNHQMDNLRYLAMYNPGYVKPAAARPVETGAIAAFRQWQKEDLQKYGAPYVRFGPGVVRTGT